jgi:hypothetical protein
MAQTQTKTQTPKAFFNRLMKDLNVALIRFKANEYDKNEILFFKLSHDGNTITIEIDKNMWRVNVEDYYLGYFNIINYEVDNSELENEIREILREFGENVEIEYIRPLSKMIINRIENKANDSKMLNIIERLYKLLLIYIKSTLNIETPKNINHALIQYIYKFGEPILGGYSTYTSNYSYSFTNLCTELNISKIQENGEIEDVYQISINSQKYLGKLLNRIIRLVLESRIKTMYYEIEIKGEKAIINNKNINVKPELPNEILNLINAHIEYIINEAKNKISLLI